jgi:PBP1b-binding outer membrane lipoprotein LpoB
MTGSIRGAVDAGSGRELPGRHRGVGVRVAVVAFSAMLVAACAPVRVSQTHTRSTSAMEPPNMTELAREPVATVGLFAPSSLQGFSPLLSHALVSALAEATPAIRVGSAHETVTLQGLVNRDLAGKVERLAHSTLG